MSSKCSKILIIRFSSIGDVLQCMSIVSGIKNQNLNAEIHWIVRSDIASVVAMDKRIDKVWSFDKKTGLKGLLKMSKQLKSEQFTHIYDAHSNIRSNILKLVLCPYWKRFFGFSPLCVTRSKERIKRILLFNFRINKFPKPFRGMVSFQKPLRRWGITDFSNSNLLWDFSDNIKNKVLGLCKVPLNQCICLVPSAAWEMKRWPIEYWKEVILKMPLQQFVIIGGPTDTFCNQIAKVAPRRITNFAGKTTVIESCYIVNQVALTISADTGFIHATDIFCQKGIFLAGPTAFGYPTGKHIHIIEKDMPCRPCTKDGRGKCSDPVYKKCMMDISSKEVVESIRNILTINQ